MLLPAESNQFPCELMSTEGEFSFFLASLASGGDNPAGRESDLICIGPAPSNAGSSSATTGKNSGSGDAGTGAALCSAAEGGPEI